MEKSGLIIGIKAYFKPFVKTAIGPAYFAGERGMGGAIKAENVDDGAEFTISLPTVSRS